MLYNVSQHFRFREVRLSVPPGGTVELDDDVAAEYMKTHPGLLKPAMQNTMAAPEMVRSAPKPRKKAKA